MGFLFFTGLILTTTMLWTFDLMEDDEGVSPAKTGNDPDDSLNGGVPPLAPIPDPEPDTPDTPDTPDEEDPDTGEGGNPTPIEEDLDTGASLIETAQGITLERGDDETGSFLAIRVLAEESGPLDGEVQETAWLDLYLIPEGTPVPAASDDWIGADPYETRAAAHGLQSLGRVSLGSVILDLDAYIADGSEPAFLDNRISAPEVLANAPLAMLALDGTGSEAGVNIEAVRETAILDPTIPNEALVWRVARTPDGTDWDFELVRTASGNAITGNGEDDTILIAPFEAADIAITGGAGSDQIETGIGPDINGGQGADNIILTVPAYAATNGVDPSTPVSDIALADATDSLGIVLPDASDGPVFAVNLTETSGGGNIAALEYSLVLIQTEPGSLAPPAGAALTTLLQDGSADGARVLARVQLGAELVTTNPDGSTSSIGVHNATPAITYVGALSGTLSATLPAAGA